MSSKPNDVTRSGDNTMADNDKAHETGEKGVEIIINGNREIVTEDELTFDQVTELAFPNEPTGPNVTFTVRYRYHRSQTPEPDHPMNEGEVVKISKGMIFNVHRTDKS